MKKQSLLLITAGMLAAASCNTETGNADEAQAKIDSMVNAEVELIREELKAKNDSIINELATWRADSIINARKGKKVKKRKPKPQILEAKSSSGSTGTMESKPAKPTTSSSKWGNEGDGGTTSKSKWNTGNEKKDGETSKSKWDKK